MTARKFFPCGVPGGRRQDPALPPNVIRTLRPAWDISAIAATVRRVAGSALKREPRDVVIRKSSTGSIVFDGVGALGRVVDLRRSAELIAEALESGMTDIALVVEETQPSITVDDPELRALASGKSSPSANRTSRVHQSRGGIISVSASVNSMDTSFRKTRSSPSMMSSDRSMQERDTGRNSSLWASTRFRSTEAAYAR